MSLEYSYREMKKMQEDAIERVREMQRRATLPIEAAEEKGPKTTDRLQSASTNANTNADTSADTNVNIIVTDKRFKTSNRNDYNRLHKPSKITHIIKDDELCEQILLISIIILLMNERTDNILILAILYILSD